MAFCQPPQLIVCFPVFDSQCVVPYPRRSLEFDNLTVGSFSRPFSPVFLAHLLPLHTSIADCLLPQFLQEEEEEVEENAEADGDVGEPMLGERKRRTKAAAQHRVAAGGRAGMGHGDGSSLEEEAAYHELPAYTHPVADSKGRYPVEISPNEYAVRGLVSFSFPILILSYHRSRKRRAPA